MSASGLGLSILLLPAPRRSENTSNFSPSSCALAKRNILHLFNWSSRDHFACLLPRPCSRQQPNTNVVPVLCVDVSDRTTFLVSAVAGLSATALICTGTRLAGLVSMITADRPRAAHPTTVRVPMSSSFILIASSNQTTQCVTEKLFESRWRLRGFPGRPTFARQRTLNSVVDASGTTRNQRTTGSHVARFSVIVRDGLPLAVKCFVPRTPPA